MACNGDCGLLRHVYSSLELELELELELGKWYRVSCCTTVAPSIIIAPRMS